MSTKSTLNKGVWLIAESLIDFFLSQVLRTYGNATQILKKRKKPTARNIFIVLRIRGPYLKIEQARLILLFPLIPQKMETASLQLLANF